MPADEPKPPMSTGECPPWLDELGREFWIRYAPSLVKLGLLTELDEPTFAAACERWSLYRRSAARTSKGLRVKSSQGYAAKPEIGIAKAALDGCRSILAEFGFTPGARAKLGTRPLGEQDPLDAFRREKRA